MSNIETIIILIILMIIYVQKFVMSLGKVIIKILKLPYTYAIRKKLFKERLLCYYKEIKSCKISDEMLDSLLLNMTYSDIKDFLSENGTTLKRKVVLYYGQRMPLYDILNGSVVLYVARKPTKHYEAWIIS